MGYGKKQFQTTLFIRESKTSQIETASREPRKHSRIIKEEFQDCLFTVREQHEQKSAFDQEQRDSSNIKLPQQ